MGGGVATVAPRAPKSLHDFLIGGSELGVRRLERGPGPAGLHGRTKSPQMLESRGGGGGCLSKQSGMEAVDGWHPKVSAGGGSRKEQLAVEAVRREPGENLNV